MKQKTKSKILFSVAIIALVGCLLSVNSYLIGDYFTASTLTADKGGLSILPYQETSASNPSWFIFQGNPGDKFGGRVKLDNQNSKKTFVAEVYPVDVNLNAGGFAPESRDNSNTGPSTWIKFKQSKVAIEPLKTELVEFRGMIPTQSTPGQHAIALIVEANEAKKSDLTKDSGAGAANMSSALMAIKTRVGIRTYISVLGEMINKIEVGNPIMMGRKKPADPIIFKLPITNTGNAITKPVINAQFFDWKNNKIDEIKGVQMYEIQPTGQIYAEVPWKFNGFGRFTGKFTVSYENASDTIFRELVFNIYPPTKYTTIAGVILLFLIINLFFFLRKKKDSQPMQYMPMYGGPQGPMQMR